MVGDLNYGGAWWMAVKNRIPSMVEDGGERWGRVKAGMLWVGVAASGTFLGFTVATGSHPVALFWFAHGRIRSGSHRS